MAVLSLMALFLGVLLILALTWVRYPAIQRHRGSVADACLWLLVAVYWLVLMPLVLSFVVLLTLWP